MTSANHPSLYQPDRVLNPPTPISRSHWIDPRYPIRAGRKPVYLESGPRQYNRRVPEPFPTRRIAFPPAPRQPRTPQPPRGAGSLAALALLERHGDALPHGAIAAAARAAGVTRQDVHAALKMLRSREQQP